MAFSGDFKMNHKNTFRPIALTLIALWVSANCWTSVSMAVWRQEDKARNQTNRKANESGKARQEKTRQVNRAKRPDFSKKDWAGIFFENIFTNGFRGEKPLDLAPKTNPQIAEDGQSDDSAAKKLGWSKIIDRSVIEDEIKRIQIQLEQQVTTPNKFKSDHSAVRLSFTKLAMLFGIIEQYDTDIRWKKDASFARVAFARAAANSRTGSEQAYANAKKQKESLREMVRGSNFPQQGTPAELDWADVSDRGALMDILEELFQEKLKPNSGSQSAVNSNAEEVLHNASLIAAIGQVLCLPEMDDYDEEAYAVHGKSMSRGGVDVVTGIKSVNFSLVEKGVNSISQSCSNCHDDWR